MAEIQVPKQEVIKALIGKGNKREFYELSGGVFIRRVGKTDHITIRAGEGIPVQRVQNPTGRVLGTRTYSLRELGLEHLAEPVKSRGLKDALAGMKALGARLKFRR